MTRYQRAKRLHTWISAGIAMAVYLTIVFLIGAADFISQL